MSTLLLSYEKELQRMADLPVHLAPVLDLARKVDSHRNDIYLSYKALLDVTKKSINTISEIRDRIVSINRKNNYIVVGSIAGVMTGIIMSITGMAAPLPKERASLFLIGSIIAASGVVVSIGSNLRRNMVTENLLKTVFQHLERNKECIAVFNQRRQSYFSILHRFGSFFETVEGNDVALSLFYEFADEEGFEFFDELQLDRASKNRLRSALQEIIESDAIKLKPRIWSLEFVRNTSNKTRILIENIRMMLAQLKMFIKNDPFLSRMLRHKMKDFLIEKLRTTKEPELEKAIRALIVFRTEKSIKPSASVSEPYLDIKNLPKEELNATRFALIALNTAFLVLGIFGLKKLFLIWNLVPSPKRVKISRML